MSMYLIVEKNILIPGWICCLTFSQTIFHYTVFIIWILTDSCHTCIRKNIEMLLNQYRALLFNMILDIILTLTFQNDAGLNVIVWCNKMILDWMSLFDETKWCWTYWEHGSSFQGAGSQHDRPQWSNLPTGAHRPRPVHSRYVSHSNLTSPLKYSLVDFSLHFPADRQLYFSCCCFAVDVEGPCSVWCSSAVRRLTELAHTQDRFSLSSFIMSKYQTSVR